MLDVIPTEIFIEFAAKGYIQRANQEYLSLVTFLFVLYRYHKQKANRKIDQAITASLVERIRNLEPIKTTTMFPLKEKIISGFVFRQKAWYTTAHLGVDYRANKSELFAPCDGTILANYKGLQGGNTIHFKPDRPIHLLDGSNFDGYIRFMHLDRFMVGTGKVKMGTLIGITGNTGFLTTGAHLHIDISSTLSGFPKIENFIDPERVDWNNMFDEPKPVPVPPKAVPIESGEFEILITGAYGANARSQPNTRSGVFQTLRKGDIVVCKGTVKGEVVKGLDLWFVTKRSGKYIHSSVSTRR